MAHWTDSPAAPQAVLESVNCKYKKCAGAHCSCKRNRLTCTGACRCDADDSENRLVTPTDMDVDPLLSEDDSVMECHMVHEAVCQFVNFNREPLK